MAAAGAVVASRRSASRAMDRRRVRRAQDRRRQVRPARATCGRQARATGIAASAAHLVGARVAGHYIGEARGERRVHVAFRDLRLLLRRLRGVLRARVVTQRRECGEREDRQRGRRRAAALHAARRRARARRGRSDQKKEDQRDQRRAQIDRRGLLDLERPGEAGKIGGDDLRIRFERVDRHEAVGGPIETGG